MSSLVKVILLSFLSVNFTLQAGLGFNDYVVECEMETETEQEVETELKEELLKHVVDSQQLAHNFHVKTVEFTQKELNYQDPDLGQLKRPPRVV